MVGYSLCFQVQIDQTLQQVDGVILLQIGLDNINIYIIQIQRDKILFCIFRKANVRMQCGVFGEREIEADIGFQVCKVEAGNP